MRIFYAADNSPNSALKSNLWRNNLYLPLIDLGHEVVEFKYDLRETFQNLDPAFPLQNLFIKKNRPKVTRELLNQVRTAHKQKPVDLFFSYFYDACVLPEAIDEIRRMGITTVNWYCNGSYQLDLVSEISTHYDWCLVPERFRLEDYVRMGARPIYCQEAANPNIYRSCDLPVEFDVTFIGQAYGDRPVYIKYLLDNGIDVRVWGFGWRNLSPQAGRSARDVVKRFYHLGRRMLTLQGWKNVGSRMRRKLTPARKDCWPGGLAMVRYLPDRMLGGILSDTEMIQMFSRSKINLGFSSCGNTHATGQRILQVRLRDFEVPMSGGFYMVEYMEELEEFFSIGKEIVCYTNLEDMVEKIKYYLSHDSEREQIRRAGYTRCQRDHTWHRRFQMVFQEMGMQ